MDVQALDIPDIRILTPRVHRDERGFFSETWNAAALERAGIRAAFVQDNHAYSREPGVVRGLHFQRPPKAQDKLVRVVRGAILDVAVDLRRGSPTFGRHVSARLSATDWRQIWVPKGFAHGYVTLEPDTEVIYKVTDYYSPADDAGIRWDDPALGIDWGVAADRALLSAKDRALPALGELAPPF